jgi:hypothetical protein
MATIPNLTNDTGLPANLDAEKTILGAILLDNAAHSEAAEKLEGDDFSLDSHRRIFLRMTELMDHERAVDIVTLANELAKNKEVESVGGGGLPGVVDRGLAAAAGDRGVHKDRQGQEPAAKADGDLFDGDCAGGGPERVGAGGAWGG